MKANVKDYVDRSTNEVNATELAEAAADEFGQKDVGGWLDDETHWVWDLAADAAGQWERQHKHATKIAASRSDLRQLQDKWYNTPVRVRGYNGQPTVYQIHDHKDAANALIALRPEVSRAEHAQLARKFEALADFCRKEWSKVADAAAMETWGRPFQFHDYRISGIGSDEFSREFKEDLRALAHGEGKAKRLTRAHEAAAKSRRLQGSEHEATRKPRSLAEKKDLQLLIDQLKRNPKDGDAERALRGEWGYRDADIDKIKRQTRTAGFSYKSEPMSVLFVEGRKPVPFNIDTIRDINQTMIPIIGDDGEEHDVNLKFVRQESSGPLTYPQEKLGWKREVKVDIQHPIDEEGSPKTSARAALAALAALGKRHGFKVEPVKANYVPQTRKP
jgi:hypothetical protein